MFFKRSNLPQSTNPEPLGLFLKFRTSSGFNIDVALSEAALIRMVAWMAAMVVGGTGAGWWVVQLTAPNPAPIETIQPHK